MPILHPENRSLEELRQSRRSGWSLERPFYLDAKIFELEMERIFLRHWFLAGYTSRIPRIGDYFVYNIGAESIIVVRDKSDQIRALLNICRHRGSRICLDEVGNTTKFVCPYHAWTYDLDGSLAHARHMREDFDRSGFSLGRGHVRLVDGLIFVSLAESPPDFEAFAHDLEPFLEPFEIENTKICHRRCYVANANWKLMAENLWECYHCGPAHKELASVMSYVAAIDSETLAAQRATLTCEWKQHAEKLGYKPGPVGFRPGTWWYIDRMPIRAGYLTQSRDGRPVAPLLGSLTNYNGGITGVNLYPCCFFVCCSDHVALNCFMPLDLNRTQVELTWLVRKDAVEGLDYESQEVCWLWRVTGEQDVKICENNQAGVNSRYYVPGPFSVNESFTEGVIRWYLDQIGGPS